MSLFSSQTKHFSQQLSKFPRSETTHLRFVVPLEFKTCYVAVAIVDFYAKTSGTCRYLLL